MNRRLVSFLWVFIPIGVVAGLLAGSLGLLYVLQLSESVVPVLPIMKSYVRVDISDQKMIYFKNGEPHKAYPVSTSKFGTGNAAGSRKTPLGRHRVAKKIGDGAQARMIFKSRSRTGVLASINDSKESDSEDLITSRILWLEGMEKGINKGPGIDSFERYIYVHGTSDENLIGSPASHGCVRMKNDDVIELFDIVDAGTVVDIEP